MRKSIKSLFVGALAISCFGCTAFLGNANKLVNAQDEPATTPTWTKGTAIELSEPIPAEWWNSGYKIDFDSSSDKVSWQLSWAATDRATDKYENYAGTLVEGEPENFYHYSIDLKDIPARDAETNYVTYAPMYIKFFIFRAETSYANFKVTKQYSYETPQIVSVSDLTLDNVSIGNVVAAKDKVYDYSLAGAPANKSVVFKAGVDYKTQASSQIYITGDGKSTKWNKDKEIWEEQDCWWASEGYAWFQKDKTYIGFNDTEGKFSGNKEINYTALEKESKHTIEFGRLAIMNESVFTGAYHVYFKLDGNLIYAVDQKIRSEVIAGGKIHFTGDGSIDYTDIYTHETPKEISVGDLKSGSGSAGGLVTINSEKNLTFDNNDHATNYSLVFKFKYKVNELKNNQFHVGVNGDDYKWKYSSAFILNNGNGSQLNFGYVNSSNPTDQQKAKNINFSWEQGKEYKIEYGRLANMDGDKFVGTYYTYLKVDDVLICASNQAIHQDIVKGNLVFITADGHNTITDIDYVPEAYEEATVLDLNDLLGSYRCLENNGWSDHGYTATSNSRVFKMKVNTKDVSTLTGDNGYVHIEINGGSIRLSMRADGVFFAYDLDGHPTDRYYFGESEDLIPADNSTIELEFGRLRVNAGSNTGKDYVYLKVDGQLLKNGSKASEFYCDPTAEKGAPFTSNDNKFRYKLVKADLQDTTYVAPILDTDVDVISVNDLCLEGTYQNGQIELAEGHTYTYNKTSENGSVVFKGTFNWKTDANTGIHFAGVWAYPFHFNTDQGLLIWNGVDVWITGSRAKLPLNTDVEVELGRIAILDSQEEFTGDFYFYAKMNGALVNEIILSGVNSDIYGSNCLYIEQNAAGNFIKNIAINKTVTVKVGDNDYPVTVLQSGLIEMPEYSVPEGMRVFGWTLEDGETAFNPASDRIFADMTIEAVLGENKWFVDFGETRVEFEDGAELVYPTPAPTKAADETNHYTFAGWVDGTGADVAEGTAVTADMVLTAKFDAEAHVYGEWTTTTPKTCTTAGAKQRACTCGHVETAEIPASHGTITHHEATLETPLNPQPTVEYWECEDCHKKYSDAACTQELSSINGTPVHQFSKVEAKEATTEEEGNYEYYLCGVCGEKFDANGNQLTDEDIVIPMLPKEETKGCGGSIAAGALVCVLSLGATALIFKRKED